jgi:hypothetical protein
MSFRIIKTAIEAEKDDFLHQARLLLLLLRTSDKGDGSIEGITKLAKLDFLLRYPTYLQRLIPRIYSRLLDVPMESYELDTVESKMIRFRYGPWDPRYRRWIGMLVAKGLADTFLVGRTVHIKLTTKGISIAKTISEAEEFDIFGKRSILVGRIAKKLSGTGLKDLIYEVVPELTGLAWGEEIEP